MQKTIEIERIDFKLHWNKTYTRVDETQLGWYEDDVSPSMRLIQKANVGPASRLLSVGAGSTTLVDALLSHGYNNLLVNDISDVALQGIQNRVGKLSTKVEWIVDDLTNATLLNEIDPVDLWVDRAVLHFFTEEADRKTYFRLLKKLVHKYGYVILAQFNLDSAEKCTGLPVHRYDTEMLQEKLGEDFKLITNFDHDYTMPSGDLRTYVYTLFQRVS